MHLYILNLITKWDNSFNRFLFIETEKEATILHIKAHATDTTSGRKTKTIFEMRVYIYIYILVSLQTYKILFVRFCFKFKLVTRTWVFDIEKVKQN